MQSRMMRALCISARTHCARNICARLYDPPPVRDQHSPRPRRMYIHTYIRRVRVCGFGEIAETRMGANENNGSHLTPAFSVRFDGRRPLRYSTRGHTIFIFIFRARVRHEKKKK